MDEDDEFLDPVQTGKITRRSPNNLAQLRFRGTGPRYIKRGRVILYRRSAVNEWLTAGERSSTNEPLGAA